MIRSILGFDPGRFPGRLRLVALEVFDGLVQFVFDRVLVGYGHDANDPECGVGLKNGARNVAGTNDTIDKNWQGARWFERSNLRWRYG